ncbi:hypothetical protein [Bacterioplanes sanyensis]|uniref:hypothetical protein n=1 Tax=Bacterioplanes sanyensis TaxID=1249553 RepID=UPI0016774B30|nr:hypothetical protein [Bacterioplanes sanyensis]
MALHDISAIAFVNLLRQSVNHLFSDADKSTSAAPVNASNAGVMQRLVNRYGRYAYHTALLAVAAHGCVGMQYEPSMPSQQILALSYFGFDQHCCPRFVSQGLRCPFTYPFSPNNHSETSQHTTQ